MKKSIFKLFLGIGFLGITLSGCTNAKTNPYANDSRYKIYKMYKAQGGDMSYEEWLETIRGEDGATIIYGESLPTETDGKNGDVYINIITWDLYIKTDGAWYIFGNIMGGQGEQGLQGEPGADGSSVLTGNGVPSNDLGKSNDSYIDLLTFDFYVKEDEGWVLKGNIKGDAGENGTNGHDGTNGIDGQNGKDGTSMRTGNGAPSNEVGQTGDTYIDLDTWDFYLKVNDTWVLSGNIKGEPGKDLISEDDQGLAFYLLDDGTYGVGIGEAIYLSRIVIPESYKGKPVTQIVEEGFTPTIKIDDTYKNPHLEEIVIPNSITTIGKNAFYGQYFLEKVTLPNSITCIEEDAFRDVGLSYNVSNNICYLGNGSNRYFALIKCVEGATLPDTIEIEEGCSIIANNAFYDVYDKSVILADTIKNFNGMLNYGSSLEFSVKDSNELFISEDGIIYDKQKTTVYLCSRSVEGALSLSDTITRIEDYAFYETRLSSVVIPNSVTYLGKYSFYYSDYLTSVSLSNSIEIIPDGAFGQTSLSSITIPNGVKEIGHLAFYQCLRSIALPTSLEHIKSNAFKQSYMSNIYYAGSEEQWNQITIGNSVDTLFGDKSIITFNSDYDGIY